MKILGFYQGVSGQDLKFSLNDAGTCVVGPTNPNNVSFPCGQGGDIDVEGNGAYGTVKVVYQPWETMQYYAAVGVGEYALKVPSTTVTNRLNGDTPGVSYTLGAKAVIFPDSVGMPALAVDASASWARQDLNRQSPGGTPNVSGNIDQRLDLLTYQVSVEASHLFTVVEKDKLDLVALKGGVRFEPYGGVRWSRTVADLKDLVDGGHAGGSQDVVTPFLGLRVPLFEHEAVFAESSFVGGFHHAFGLEVRFE
ncbi:MAG: autotransporter outer membrane beta-barrel domain-containing protein [Elusimicrobia bacterium]|nr:autotransporter outer membrane beta-barrel domain-containing protein [Elusimicrobiota bacterium]